MKPIPAITGALIREAKLMVSKYSAVFITSGLSGGQLGYPAFRAVKVSVGVRPGRHTDQRGADLLRPQAGEHETLLSTHAASVSTMVLPSQSGRVSR